MERDAELHEKLDRYIADGYIRPGDDVSRIQSPTDSSFLLPGVVSASVLVISVLVARGVWQALPSFFMEYISLSVVPFVGFGVFLPSFILHEAGHYIIAQQYMDPELDVGMRAVVVPVFVVRVNDSYVLPRNKARAISLAGPVTGLTYISTVAAVYLLFSVPHWAGAAVIPGIIMHLFPLLPFFKGDGYNIIAKTVGNPQLWEDGIADVKQGVVSDGSLYIAVTAVCYMCVLVLFGYTASQVNRLTSWAVFVIGILAYKLWTVRS